MRNLMSLGPAQLKRLADTSFSALILSEIGRARARIAELQRTYPSAKREELATRLVDAKKKIAGTSGAVSGLFGLASVPLDLVLVAYLQTATLVDIAVLHRVNLKSARAQEELLDLLAWINGADPMVRASPKLLGSIAVGLFKRGGFAGLGRAVPVVAAPVTAWLNHRALSRAGREATLFYSREGRREHPARA